MNKRRSGKGVSAVLLTVGVLAVVPLAGPQAVAQNPQLQQRLAEIKQAVAVNKQALARYTWHEQQTVIINGEVKKQELFQVHVGPDGKPQKTLLRGSPPSNSPGGPIRQRIVEKKTAEYEQYAQQIAALAQSYAQPDPQRLQQAYQQGNITLGPAGVPDEARLMITSYMKSNDSVGILFNRAQKAILSVQISSYLNDPKDAVEIAVQFGNLADGTTHVSSMIVNGVSKKLSVRVQNSDYHKL